MPPYYSIRRNPHRKQFWTFLSLMILTALLQPGRSDAGPLPIPDPEEQKAARAEIEKIYGERYKAASSPSERVALGHEMIEMSRRIDNASERYCLLQSARNISISYGNVDLLKRALKDLSFHFNVDNHQQRIKSLLAIEKHVSDPAQLRVLGEEWLPFYYISVAKENYSEASNLLKKVGQIAYRSKAKPLYERCLGLKKDLETMQEGKRQAEEGLERLEKVPNHASSHEKVGKYLTLMRGDYRFGIPHLAKGEDAALKAIAELELTHPQEAEDEIAMGNRWWKYAESQSGVVSSYAKWRAAFWYEQTIGKYDGIQQVRALDRIREIERESPFRIFDFGNVVVYGTGFRLSSLGKDQRVFTNRDYPWGEISPQYEDWMYTIKPGGQSVDLSIYVQETTDVWIASDTLEDFVDMMAKRGWRQLPDSHINYIVSKVVDYEVFTKHVGAGITLHPPQQNFTGVVFIAPGL